MVRAALLLALVWAAPAWGEDATLDVPVAIATAPDDRAADPAMSIDDQMQAYLDTNGFSERERRGEIAILRGTATVDVPSTNPQWVAQRSLAYEQALLNAQSDYVVKQNVQITAQTASEMFQAAGREPPPFDPGDKDTSRLAELVRKLVALGTGKIDKELRDLNINPEEYAKAPEPQRYVQMKDALTLKGIERSFGELTGLTPVQSFEKPIGSDIYKVGVVAVVSPRMKDFAKRVLTERGQFPPEPGRASKLADLYADKTKLARDFGVRWRYDEAGLPVIVSFAQWESDYKGQDPVLAERYRDTAYKQAEIRADAQIADFLKGSVNVNRTSEVGRQMTEAADRMPDGYVAQQPVIQNLVNAYQSSVRRNSQVSITGLTTLARWADKHPETGQPILGVIRIWSAAGEQGVRALRDGRPAAGAAAAQAPSGPGAGHAGRKLMDSTDF